MSAWLPLAMLQSATAAIMPSRNPSASRSDPHMGFATVYAMKKKNTTLP
jgi:hypothetical protein